MACSMASVLMRRVRNSLGEGAIEDLLRTAGVSQSPEYLDDVGNWMPYEDAGALMEAAVTVTGDEEIVRRAGADTVRQHAGSAVATLLRSLGSPQAVFEQLTLAATKFSTVIDLVPLEIGPGRAVVRAKAKPGYTRHRRHCEYTQGMLSQPTALFGLPPASVKESCCELRGDDHCLYTVTWDAARAADAADPQELVTALEAQLAAMTGRLENMYATARDLIALDDVDAALTRITERAATAVRAPSYLLAVRAGRADELHVHHRGFGDGDAHEAARELLAETDLHAEASRLVVDVASASRHYGRLMAATPDGAFFPHERDLLDVYARYAAAVLDTATALDEARRRHEQAQALLDLAQAVATANTSGEVAERLAGTVPAVVDCDRAFVFLWSEEKQALTCHAAAGSDPGTSFARDLVITTADTPYLARLLANPSPEPIFFDRDSGDTFVQGTMRATGSEALVVVPIVANDHVYGIMNVSVTHDPERLAPTPALLDALAGVVAQAATALDNARLIETMAHQARHDNLTGLLGHRAFHEAIGDGLAGGPAYRFTLAMIDIDDFKQINDAHGHPVGDEALRLVAEALQRSVREDDRVFRVGGEEFAVVLPGMSAEDAAPAAERLRRAVAETQFCVPLRVSVGLASYPAGASDRDALIQQADSALYAAKRAGKDRVSLAA
jgi:diguanylate cyclase (GGDEF)-like protein